jgi:uncharacterized protein (TIGR00661 family)
VKALFLVNGTGMGHITQTFALVELFALQNAPLTPVAVMVTNCAPGKLALLREYYRCPVVEAPSLRFHTNAAGEISPVRTAWGSLCDLGDCRRSAARLHALIAETKPDVVINFYEALGGFYRLLHRAATPWVAVAHQYMVHHPSYLRHARFHPQRQVLNLLTRLTGHGATLRVALSFYPAESRGNLVVTAPLLRQNVLAATPRTGDHLLCYLNNGTHLPKLVRYCQRHPDQLVRCFCPDQPATAPANLEMHRPDWTRYIEELVCCRGLIATAGFESVAEAGVLGKPAVVIPLKNQLEQELNARDALRHHLILRAVAPDAELPDVDWQSPRPPDEYRQFVRTENRRLCDRLQQFLQPSPVLAPQTCEPALS